MLLYNKKLIQTYCTYIVFSFFLTNTYIVFFLSRKITADQFGGMVIKIFIVFIGDFNLKFLNKKKAKK